MNWGRQQGGNMLLVCCCFVAAFFRGDRLKRQQRGNTLPVRKYPSPVLQICKNQRVLFLWGPDSDVDGIDDGDTAGEFFEVGAADEI